MFAAVISDEGSLMALPGEPGQAKSNVGEVRSYDTRMKRLWPVRRL